MHMDYIEIFIERVAKVVGVISFVITIILGITGVVSASIVTFVIIFIPLFIALCVLYFLIIGIYKGLKWSYAKGKFFLGLIVVLSSLISIPVGVIYGVDSLNRLSTPDTYLLYFGIIRITDPTVAFFATFVTTAFQVFILTFTAGYVIRWVCNVLKPIYVRHKFFFRLIVVLSSLISIPVGVIYGINSLNRLSTPDTYLLYFGIIRITNPTVAFFMCFVANPIIIFIFIFTTGQVLYFTIRWVRDGSKGNQFYLRLTVMLSIISSFVGAFIAAVDMSRITTTRWDRRRGIADFIADYGVEETIAAVDVNPSITSVFVAAICGAGVWIIYLSILWIYRGLDSDGDE